MNKKPSAWHFDAKVLNSPINKWLQSPATIASGMWRAAQNFRPLTFSDSRQSGTQWAVCQTGALTAGVPIMNSRVAEHRAVPRSGSPLRFCVASEIPICLRERRIVVAREEGAARVVAHRKGVVPALINPAAFEEETSGRALAASGKHRGGMRLLTLFCDSPHQSWPRKQQCVCATPRATTITTTATSSLTKTNLASPERPH